MAPLGPIGGSQETFKTSTQSVVECPHPDSSPFMLCRPNTIAWRRTQIGQIKDLATGEPFRPKTNGKLTKSSTPGMGDCRCISSKNQWKTDENANQASVPRIENSSKNRCQVDETRKKESLRRQQNSSKNRCQIDETGKLMESTAFNQFRQKPKGKQTKLQCPGSDFCNVISSQKALGKQTKQRIR